MLEGDLIVALGGRPVAGIDDLQRALTADVIGRSTEIIVLRRGARRALRVVPAESERN